MSDSRFDDPLAREILRGLHLRATILAGVFAGVAVVLGVLVLVDALAVGRDVVPEVVPLLPVLLALHQVVLRWHIGRGLEGEVRVPEGFWYLNTFAEISSVSLVTLVVAGMLEYPIHALQTPPVYLYFVFIILSTLRLDFRSSVFTGGVAAVELVAVYAVLEGVSVGTPAVEPMLDSPFPVIMKGVLLLASGLAAGFVARELRGRIFGAVVSAARRERSAAFLASMSHEIRTPLNAIVGYAELLEKDGGLDEEHRHAVATMKSSGDHLLGVVNQALDLSRIEAGREELEERDFDLGTLGAALTAMFELPCRSNGVTWRATVEPAAARVRGDAVRLRQVLINLAGNAIRFTESGEVELRIEEVGPGTDDSGPAALHKRVFRFEVRDTGPGIPREEQSLVFEPFRTDHRGLAGVGSGLGLAIAYAQVRLMGGRLELESTPGVGSRFFFTLRLDPGDPDSAPLAVSGEVVGVRREDGGPVVAVIADPSPVSRVLLARMLRRVGVEVREVESADDARAIIAAVPPDVVFFDPSLAAAPPAAARGTRMMAVSSSVLEHERRAVLDAGFDALLGRPVATDRLYDCLAELPGVELERAPARPAGAGSAGNPSSADGPADVVGVTGALPASLWSSLRDAAGDYNVTDLRKQLARLDELGEDVRPLAEHLRALTRRYDLEAIRAVLDEVPHG